MVNIGRGGLLEQDALCDALDVPDSERWGSDKYRQAPPRRG